MQLTNLNSKSSPKAIDAVPASGVLDPEWLRAVAHEAGADDVGFVSIDRPEIAQDRDDILRAFPVARTLVSFVVRMNPDSIRSPARSVANLEFHHAGDETNAIARRIIARLRGRGYRGINPSMGFPMEMDRFPSKIWVVSHKKVAEAAGLGKMGIHRNVIHPKLGNFILLGTVVTDAVVGEEAAPIDYDPCLECKLCVAACPVGAIAPDGRFDFGACYTHNYREFMGGFTTWVEAIAESRSATDYRARVSDSESASMWQSLSYGANYKAAYCMAVCPAGEDIIPPFRLDRAKFKKEVVRPLREKKEPVYVVPGSDAEAHVEKRFPHKTRRRVASGLRPTSIAGMLRGLHLVFQRGRAADLDATYHFVFSGDESIEATVAIKSRSVVVSDGLVGHADLRVDADSSTWLGIVRQERSPVWALLTRRLRVRGPLSLLDRFQACFSG